MRTIVLVCVGKPEEGSRGKAFGGKLPRQIWRKPKFGGYCYSCFSNHLLAHIVYTATATAKSASNCYCLIVAQPYFPNIVINYVVIVIVIVIVYGGGQEFLESNIQLFSSSIYSFEYRCLVGVDMLEVTLPSHCTSPHCHTKPLLPFPVTSNPPSSHPSLHPSGTIP